MSARPFTRGPWQWLASDRRVMLSTVGRGQVFVMGFKRMGMQDAQPIFQRHKPECDGGCSGCGLMTPATEFSQPFDHNGNGHLDHPDAHLIAAAPDLYEALARCCDELAYLHGGIPNPFPDKSSEAETIGWATLAKARGELADG